MPMYFGSLLTLVSLHIFLFISFIFSRTNRFTENYEFKNANAQYHVAMACPTFGIEYFNVSISCEYTIS